MEPQVTVAGRTLPLSVVGRLYLAANNDLTWGRDKEAVALWNAMQRADKRAKGIAFAPVVGPMISAERLDELLAADAARASRAA